MRYLFCLPLFLLFRLSAIAQSDTIDVVNMPQKSVTGEIATKEVVEGEAVYKVVEEMPEYPGGQEKLLAFLGRVQYPIDARANDVEGVVYVQFVVDRAGKVVEGHVARSSGHYILDTAALNHVMKMETWKPGKQAGKTVRVQYVVPMRFQLGPVVPPPPKPTENAPASPRAEPSRKRE